MQKNKKVLIFGILVLVILAGVILALPPVWSRVSYYANKIYTEIYYKINPPQEVIFNPQQTTPDDIATAVQQTVQAAQPQSTPEPTKTATNTPIPLPVTVYLQGVEPEAQMWNNCGPATLSMALSYWKWNGDQEDTAALLKPNPRDKNVMPYEMVDFVNDQTNLRALIRMGGDLYTLKSLLNAGFPVLVEKGFEPENLAREGWMGHYNLVIGYDDTTSAFTTQDSYLLALKKYEERAGTKGFEVTYDDMLKNWRAFNSIFIVIYPPEYENDVVNALGPLADETGAYQVAYERAMTESSSLLDARDRYFAFYNVGTSLVKLQDYEGAAAAFDTAFALYPSIDEVFGLIACCGIKPALTTLIIIPPAIRT